MVAASAGRRRRSSNRFSRAAWRKRISPTAITPSVCATPCSTTCKRFPSLDEWPRGDWKSQTEIEFTFPLAEGLEISGRIDRLDVAPDGRAFVMDYKYSGAQRVRDKLKNENLMQAPLYVMAAERS